MSARIATVLVTCLATLALATIAWIGILRFTKPSIQTAWAEGLYQRKVAAAQRLPKNRIVIIGGSGAHYGFSGREVSRLTGLPAVNLGVHAGLGLPYLLYRAEQVLAPGDFAVLAIEPNLYASDNRPSSVLSEFVLRYDLPYLLNTRISDALSILYGVSPSDVVEEQARRALPWTSQLGRAETVDELGDETLVLSRIQTPDQLANLRRTGPFTAWSISQPPQRLTQFFSWAKSNGVRFGLAWTPLLDDPIYRLPAHQTYFAKVTKWHLDAGGIQLGPATDYFQPEANMFDYVFHDNEKGRIAASRTLAAHLCATLACSVDVSSKTSPRSSP